MATKAICRCQTGRESAADTRPVLDTRILSFYQETIVIWHFYMEAKCVLHIWLSSVAQTCHCVFHSIARIGNPGHREGGPQGELRGAGTARATSLPIANRHRHKKPLTVVLHQNDR